MREYFSAYYDGFTDTSPDEVLAALGIGLVLAMACSGLCILGRNRSSNAFTVFCGLIFAVSAVSMVVGVGHARFKYMGPARSTPTDYPIHNGFFAGMGGPPHGGHPTHHILGRTLLREADINKDGQLTPEEAAQYVREVDSGGRGWVDADEIDRSRRHHDAPPAPGGFPPGPPPFSGPNPQGSERSENRG